MNTNLKRLLSLLLMLCLLLANVGGIAEQTAEITAEEIAAISPVNPVQAAAIDALPTYPAKDTWAVYVYMCGSDLESGGVDGLADVTRILTRAEREEHIANEQRVFEERLTQFANASEQAGVKLPSALYRKTPQSTGNPQGYAESVEQGEEGEAELPASGTEDLKELFQVQLPENIRFVIQTGGALTWNNHYTDSNRSQRFVYDSTGFHEVENNAVQNMGNPDTLKGFLRFCEENYQADHKILLFWNHGAGAFGYATDEIFNHDTLTLKEMQSALSEVYAARSAVPFELIGFDACLMASLEVANYLADYGRYLVASEELEPGFGWDYSKWVADFAANTATNGARIGRSIVDGSIKASVENSKKMGYDFDITLSVTDLSQVPALYASYEEFAKEALRASIEQPQYLAFLGQKANRSMRYAQEQHNTFNTLDLGDFMDRVEDFFPDTVKAVKSQLKKASIYQRNSTYVQSSQGLSVYFPTKIEDLAGFQFFLNYIGDISDSKPINALYHYKIGAFLNEKYQKYADENALGTAKAIHTDILADLAAAEIKIEDTLASIQLSKEQMDLIQETSFALASQDSKTGNITYYGFDYLVEKDAQNKVFSNVDAKWFGLGKELLSVKVLDYSDTYIKYCAPVLYQKEKAVLVFVYDLQKNEINVLGLRKESQSIGVIDRNLIPLKKGEKITPVYEMLTGNGVETKKGNTVQYQDGILQEIALKRGEYLAFFEFSDVRGDKWQSSWMQFRSENGNVKDLQILSQEEK